MGEYASAVDADEQSKPDQEMEFATAAESSRQTSDYTNKKEDCPEKHLTDVITNQHERRIRWVHRPLHGHGLEHILYIANKAFNRCESYTDVAGPGYVPCQECTRMLPVRNVIHLTIDR